MHGSPGSLKSPADFLTEILFFRIGFGGSEFALELDASGDELGVVGLERPILPLPPSIPLSEPWSLSMPKRNGSSRTVTRLCGMIFSWEMPRLRDSMVRGGEPLMTTGSRDFVG